jgi:hypothetical protein
MDFLVSYIRPHENYGPKFFNCIENPLKNKYLEEITIKKDINLSTNTRDPK